MQNLGGIFEPSNLCESNASGIALSDHTKMASVKRKAATDDRPSKKAKPTKADSAPRSAKSSKPSKVQDEETAERKPPPRSLLQQEERAFPRGGGSVLTPLEQKQIKAEAERDVLFEQQTGRTAGEDNENDDSLDDPAASAPAKKKQKRRRQSSETAIQPEGSGIKIHGLSYKNLSVGSVVLGCVTAITARDVALALANNLTGYVPITAISERLNKRIEQLLEEEGQDDGADNDEDVNLKQLFYVGQWLRAAVTATASDSADGSGKSKRHIEISVDPRHVNGALDADGVVQNSMIQASVRSVEDHGIVMDVGLLDSGIRGFISKKALGATFKIDDLQEGQVMMCLVTGKGSNGNVLKLSPDASPFSAVSGTKQSPSVSEAPTVESFQPGTAVDVLVTESGPGGVVGKVMGMVDVTADVVQAGAGIGGEELSKKYKIGSKAKGRIIWTIPDDDGSRRIGISLLEHMLTLPTPPSKLPDNANPKLKSQATDLEQRFPLSSIVEEAKVRHVLADRGLFMTLPSEHGDANAFAHISQISDKRTDSLASTSGAYKVETTHKARIMSYNPLDNLYYVSLKPSILEQAFLRIEDLTVGEIVKGTVDRLILGAEGITGVLVKLSESITALVPEMHLSDIQLQHPERKFKEGFPVKARVLAVDLEKRHVRLTLKKSLVSEDEGNPIWNEYAELEPGMECKGTIINMLPNGGVVQFYGNVRAWLPVCEMSENFIERPEKHFRLGQTVRVRIVSVDPEAQEMKVSCKDPILFNSEQQNSWDQMTGGELVSGTITEKSTDSITVELASGLKGLVRIGHLTDGSAAKADSVLKKLHIGKTLADHVVLHKLERSRHVALTRKPTMVADAKAGSLVCSHTDAQQGRKVNGFVRNITPEGVYTEFANGVVGLLPKSQVTSELLTQPAFGLTKDQSLTACVMSVDLARERFTLSMHEQKDIQSAKQPSTAPINLNNPVDSSLSSMADITLGKVTKARIASVKATQLNVRLADNVQGRVDVSEAFDSWDDFTNKKAPLQKYKQNQILDVKLLGIHDTRNHRFLPISHRQSSNPVFELSAKRSRIEDADEGMMTMDAVKQGSSYIAFVNNHGDNCVWVSLSPNVRGRIPLMDLSDDAGQLQNLSKNFHVGCALRVFVKNVNAAENRLELSAKTGAAGGQLTIESLSPGMLLAGRVFRVSERSVSVQIADSLVAPVPLVEMGDDYDQLNVSQYKKNDIVRVCVLSVDKPNKKFFLSLRPSKVLSSSLPVRDPQVTSYAQLVTGDLVRGFIKNVDDKGVFVDLGARVDALVRVSDLSDQFIKDWKSIVQVDQLVKGRILAVDADAKHCLLGLKASHVDDNFKPPITMSDLQPGMIVTGKVRKVEDFGAFIDIDNTQPRLSGLCHRSEVAEKRVEDVRKLYAEGDVVKAKILNVDVKARKISLGLKASYFGDEDAGEDVEDKSDSGVEIDGEERDVDVAEDLDSDGGVDLGAIQDLQSNEGDTSEVEDADEMDEDKPTLTSGLKAGGFDWTGDSLGPAVNGAASDSEIDIPTIKKRKRHKPEIKVDLTGDLDKYGLRSTSDFERQLLGQPNDSGLWVQYMAFQLQLSEVQKAREIAERALRTIHIREVEEKANVWIAWLNLEVEYGDEERVEEVFKEACQVQDSLEMHEKLASIYIDSGKPDKADAIFGKIVGNKTFRASPEVWLNYANFLFDTLKAPLRARSLLSRALQSVPTNEHRLLTAKFAALEFRSAQGDAERGRTIFEGLVSEWPKWYSGWDMWLDLERSRIGHAKSEDARAEAREKVRALFERIASQKMKKRRAKFIFKRWLEFEEADGNAKNVERVKVLAKEYVEAQQAKGGDEMEE